MSDDRNVDQILKEWKEPLDEAADRWWKVSLEDEDMIADLKKALKGVRTQVGDNPETRGITMLAVDASRIKLPELAKVVAGLYRGRGFSTQHDDNLHGDNSGGKPQTIAQIFGLSQKELGERLTEELKKELADGLGIPVNRIKVVEVDFYNETNAAITFQPPGNWPFKADGIFYSDEGKVLQVEWHID